LLLLFFPSSFLISLLFFSFFYFFSFLYFFCFFCSFPSSISFASSVLFLFPFTSCFPSSFFPCFLHSPPRCYFHQALHGHPAMRPLLRRLLPARLSTSTSTPFSTSASSTTLDKEWSQMVEKEMKGRGNAQQLLWHTAEVRYSYIIYDL
jgi:hypothetical protein